MAKIVKAAEKNKTVVFKSDADQIYREIRKTMPEVCITKIEAVQNNKFLHAAYQIRKAQHIRARGSCPTEDLYHATAQKNVASILKDNLNWRLVKRSRFGVGVSFSSTPSYANKFSNDKNGSKRAFIVCEVLVVNVQKVGSNYSAYPMKNIDTYKSKSNMVVVKFEDHTFYPKCVVYYKTSSNGPYRTVPDYVGIYSDSDSDSDSSYYYDSDSDSDDISAKMSSLKFY